jgi:hypothetical protein
VEVTRSSAKSTRNYGSASVLSANVCVDLRHGTFLLGAFSEPELPFRGVQRRAQDESFCTFKGWFSVQLHFNAELLCFNVSDTTPWYFPWLLTCLVFQFTR